MKVFISWSGKVSNQISKVIANWIPDVIQGTEIFLSSQDIAKGERNAQSMWDALDGFDYGLSVVTTQNKNAPWIMFEAGAMMRFPSGRVVPLLCNLDRLDISSTPLNSFQCASLSKSDMLAVIKSMNEAAGLPITASKLERSFERWWPDFEQQISEIDLHEPAAKSPEPLDHAEHFRRLENGITAIMNRVDSMYKEAIVEREITRTLDEISSGGVGLNDPYFKSVVKWATKASPSTAKEPELTALQKALRKRSIKDVEEDGPNNP